jgi:hypothetical protein
MISIARSHSRDRFANGREWFDEWMIRSQSFQNALSGDWLRLLRQEVSMPDSLSIGVSGLRSHPDSYLWNRRVCYRPFACPYYRFTSYSSDSGDTNHRTMSAIWFSRRTHRPHFKADQ